MKNSFQIFALLFGLVSMAQAPAIQWQKTLGGTGLEIPGTIQQTSDGGYIVVGSTTSNDGNVSGYHGGNGDVWVVKLDNGGSVSWQKALGGSGVEEGYDIQQTSDGGFIVAAYAISNDGDVSGNHGNSDAWIIKLDNLGNISWQKTFGGSSYDYARSVQQTTDGGYVFAGSTSSNDGDVTGTHDYDDGWIVKIDTLGSIVWQRTFAGEFGGYAYDIDQTSDGGYIVGGDFQTDGDVKACVVKLDNLGAISWQKLLGGSNSDIIYSIQQTIDGGYIFAGFTGSNNGDVTGNHGGWDEWIVKLDNLGNISWQKAFGGSGTDVAYNIQQTTNGGYIVGGYTISFNGDVLFNHGSNDAWILRLDNLGNILWQKSMGGTISDERFRIQQTTDGGYITAGYSASNNGDVFGNHGGGDFWVVKLGSDLANESFESESFTIYPNPTANIVRIQNANNTVVEHIVITDVLGKKVFETNKNVTEINVESFQKGLYLIEIASEGKTECNKFVKE